MVAESIGERLALRAAEIALQVEAEHPANLDMAIQELACKIAQLELQLERQNKIGDNGNHETAQTDQAL